MSLGEAVLRRAIPKILLAHTVTLCYNKLTISPPTEVTTTMRHRIHDGPAPDSDEAVMISRFHARTKPTPRATLAALQWAADKAGMSYGRFLQTLGPSDEGAIQEEYESFLRERSSEMAARRRVCNDVPVTGGFIISDEDA